MARLSNFRSFLVEARDTLKTTETKLLAHQAKYETFFAELGAVRESEFRQLRDHIVNDREHMPPTLLERLEKAQAEAEAAFQESRAALEAKRRELTEAAETIRTRSRTAEAQLRSLNTALDAEEEELKARELRLAADIEDFNERIRSLGSGLGFFWNFFDMRSLQTKRTALLNEQRDVAARVESLRSQWATAAGEEAKHEAEMQKSWVELETEAATLGTKLDALDQTHSSIVERSALEAVLFELAPKLAEPARGDPPCPRCQAPNPASNNFCRICAHRLTKDRPDFRGSAREIAEVNLHHARFAKGVKACQEIIGLVRGLITGHGNFMKSVDKMIDSENRYPLAKLQIDVPPSAVTYARSFEELRRLAEEDVSLHPVEFAEGIGELIGSTFTEEKIKGYFETMGNELSTQAKRQWK